MRRIPQSRAHSPFTFEFSAPTAVGAPATVEFIAIATGDVVPIMLDAGAGPWCPGTYSLTISLRRVRENQTLVTYPPATIEIPGAAPAQAPAPAHVPPVLRSASISPRVICRTRRSGCPTVARLRVTATPGARATIVIERVRQGRRSKRVRSLTLNLATGSRSSRIRGRGLRAGR